MATKILADAQNRDDVLMVVETEQELELLIMYRKANAIGKRRITKTLCAARDGLLPSVEKIHAMTTAEKCAFADALPEVQL